MKKTYSKICHLLASSGFREQEIAEFAGELISYGQNRFISDISRFRRSALGLSTSHVLDVPSYKSGFSMDDVGPKIERLLIHEAGMQKSLAIQRLTAEIESRIPGFRAPPESRKGFQAWIGRLMETVSHKELLHIATNLRNKMVHDSPADWRLK